MLEDLKNQLVRCGEFLSPPEGSTRGGEQEPPDAGPWFPRLPDTKFRVFMTDAAEARNRVGTVEIPDGDIWGVTWRGVLPSSDPPQGGVFPVDNPYHSISHPPANRVAQVRTTVQLAADESPEQSDPRASCGRKGAWGRTGAVARGRSGGDPRGSGPRRSASPADFAEPGRPAHAL